MRTARSVIGGTFLIALLSVAVLAGCSRVSVGADSPRVVDVRLEATSAMTEESQMVTVRLQFDKPIIVDGDGLADIRFLLNNVPVDDAVIRLEARPSADALTLVLSPASSRTTTSSSYFALYESRFSLNAIRSDGALPSIKGQDGSTALLDEPVTGTLPSGICLEVLESVPASGADATPARAVVKVVSPPQVRAITWFSVDGGRTALLKHNHAFADADAQTCAQDLAAVVNGHPDLGVVARAQQDTVVLTATAIEDGCSIEPVVIEGIGVYGGTLDDEERAALL